MKKKYYSAVRKNILISMILVPGIPFIFILIIGSYYFTTSLETNTILRMERIAEDHCLMIDSFLKERKTDLEFIADSYSFLKLSHLEELDILFANLQKKSNAFVDLGIFNEAGVHVAYHGIYKLKGKIYKDADWFKEVVKQGYYISNVFLGYRRIPHFVIAVAKEKEGEKWIIRATIDTLMFSNLVKKVRIGRTGEAYILNSKGILQTERRSGGNLMDKLADNISLLEHETGIHTFISKDAAGKKYLYATSWLKEKKWLLLVRQEKDDAFSTLHTAVYIIIFIMLIGGFIIIGVAFYMTNRIVNKVERMDTEKENLGQQLIGASRLAEIGKMSTGFAHEINNPLQIMKSEQALIDLNMEELKKSHNLEELESFKELEDSMDQIKFQISRCARITQAILKFGRQDEPVLQDIDLQQIIREVAGMVDKRAKDSDVLIKKDIEPDVPSIKGDPSQLQQVLVNLFNNAIYAIEEQHGSIGGELLITVKSQKNEMIEILVKDNGCGISSENFEKVFSPFFTTKAVGKGTGLGLSVCYGIIKNMKGTMKVKSEEGKGTTFIIQLPVAHKGRQ